MKKMSDTIDDKVESGTEKMPSWPKIAAMGVFAVLLNLYTIMDGCQMPKSSKTPASETYQIQDAYKAVQDTNTQPEYTAHSHTIFK